MESTNNKYDGKFRYLTDEEIKADEDELDTYDLKHKLMVKGRIIKTYGDLRKIITSTKIARKFEDFLEDDEFYYFYNWILEKEIKEKKLNKLTSASQL